MNLPLLSAAVLPMLGAVVPEPTSVAWWWALVNTILYSVMGIVILCVGFIVIDKITPYDLWKELIESKNMALAIVVGLMSLGICIIIASAMH